MTKKRRTKQKGVRPSKKKEPKSLSPLTNEEIQQKLVAKYPTLNPYPNSSPIMSFKDKLGLVIVGMIGIPLTLLITFGSRNVRDSSFLPVFVVMVIGQIWMLLILIGHHSISQEDFYALTPENQQKHRLYDAFWDGLTRSGFGMYTAMALVWGLIELGISQDQLIVSLVLVGIDVVLAIGLLIKHDWLALVLVEGLKKHNVANRIWSGILGILFVLMVVGWGMGSVARVTTRIVPESRDMVISLIMVGFNIVFVFVFVYSLSGLVIVKAYYHQYNYLTHSGQEDSQYK